MGKKKHEKMRVAHKPVDPIDMSSGFDTTSNKNWWAVADNGLAVADVREKSEWRRNELAMILRSVTEVVCAEWNKISQKVQDSSKLCYTVAIKVKLDRSSVPTTVGVQVRGSELIVNRAETHQVDDPDQQLLVDAEAKEAGEQGTFPPEEGAEVSAEVPPPEDDGEVA